MNPPNPNAIIRALLDIAQAAYVVIHSPSKDMADNLKEKMDAMESLPQYCNNPVNPVARASHYLQSFLQESVTINRSPMYTMNHTPLAYVSRDVVERLKNGEDVFVQACSKPFHESFDQPIYTTPTLRFGAPDFGLREGVDFMNVKLGEPLTEIESMPDWKAPATALALKPTAEFPTHGRISHDFYTHRDSWRHLMSTALAFDPDDKLLLEHELAAFDRAFATLPVWDNDKLRINSFPPSDEAVDTLVKEMREEAQRKLQPRLKEDESASFSEVREAWYAVFDALTMHAPGWHALAPRAMDAAVQTIEQLATSAKNEIRTNMLADTADEALRIINDAGLLKNLVELFTMRDAGTTVKIYEEPPKHNGRPWRMDIEPSGDLVGRTYESTSIHQLIAVAHKGEQDHEYPEHEQCQFCGFTVEVPCEAPPPAECPTAVAAQIASMPKPTPVSELGPSVDPACDRRRLMEEKLKKVMHRHGANAARKIITSVGKSEWKMRDIPAENVEAVIIACEKARS